MALPRAAFALVGMLTFGGCTGQPSKDAADSSGSTDSSDSGTPDVIEACGYTPAADLDPAAHSVEVDLRASSFAWDPGTGVPLDEGMAFAGSVPGPLIEATVGDTLRVHFHNDLSLPLTVHWHGLRIPEAMDGGMSQMMDPVQPGDSFDYEFVVPDAGYYWYHPHLDGATTIERGLYGPIIIHGADEAGAEGAGAEGAGGVVTGKADCDLPLMLDDILLDEDTLQVAPPDTSMNQLMGRLGNLLMVNGRSDRHVALLPGETVLMRLANPSNARFWDVYVEGQQLQVVGTDGGWLGEPYAAEHVLIAPGERYMVTFTATGQPGDSFRLMNRRFQLHEEGGDMVEYDPMGNGENPALTFVLGDGTPEATPWVQPASSPPPWTGPTEVLGHHWQLSEDMAGGTVAIDGEVYPNVPVVDVMGGMDTTFEVENLSEMHHPFHIHGNNYMVVAVNGEPLTTPPAWKDTFNIPPRSTVTVVSDLSNPGGWMYHCHILEHADSGMMGVMMVE